MQERFTGLPFPQDVRDCFIAINLKSHLPRTLLAEGEGAHADLIANRVPPNLGSLPLIVLSEGKPNDPFMQERLKTWFELQEELAKLSTNGKHIVAAESAHNIHRTESDLIFDAVPDVVGKARSKN